MYEKIRVNVFLKFEIKFVNINSIYYVLSFNTTYITVQ